ncbi:MAG: hypothetical protein JST93_36060 [Acidobacteria bacterium]|nr:hypothetical protein [Acidobacteriota bacterium]
MFPQFPLHPFADQDHENRDWFLREGLHSFFIRVPAEAMKEVFGLTQHIHEHLRRRVATQRHVPALFEVEPVGVFLGQFRNQVKFFDARLPLHLAEPHLSKEFNAKVVGVLRVEPIPIDGEQIFVSSCQH